MQFGHPATSSYYYPDDGDKGESTYEWNANGQLIGGKWTETYKEYDSNNDNPTTVTDYGEIRVGYNADGHMAWKIDHSITETSSSRLNTCITRKVFGPVRQNMMATVGMVRGPRKIGAKQEPESVSQRVLLQHRSLSMT